MCIINKTDDLNMFTTYQLRKYGIKIMDILKYIMGERKDKKTFKFKIRNNLKNCYGQYEYKNERNIVINPSECKTMELFVKTCIHEYTHHLQKYLKTKYESSVKKYGYLKSPFEIEARDNEVKYFDIVWNIFILELSKEKGLLS